MMSHQANWEAVDVRWCQPNGTTVWINYGQIAYIDSPGYPRWNLPHLNCHFTIKLNLSSLPPNMFNNNNHTNNVNNNHNPNLNHEPARHQEQSSNAQQQHDQDWNQINAQSFQNNDNNNRHHHLRHHNTSNGLSDAQKQQTAQDEDHLSSSRSNSEIETDYAILLTIVDLDLGNQSLNYNCPSPKAQSTSSSPSSSHNHQNSASSSSGCHESDADCKWTRKVPPALNQLYIDLGNENYLKLVRLT